LRPCEHALSKRGVHVFGQRDEFAIVAKSTDVAVVVIVAIALFGGDVAFAFDNNHTHLWMYPLTRDESDPASSISNQSLVSLS
jgi:hypothetical protein